MAFFDDMGKRLTQAGQTAVQKTKDLADITRINGMISEEEKNLESIFSNLGKMYFSLHSEDCEDCFAPMVSSIKEAEVRIAQYQQQVKDIKGVTRCEVCGADVPNNAAFCSGCGTPVPKKIPEGMVQCQGCGQLLSADTKFCTSCGTPTPALVAPAPVAPEPVAPAVEPVAEAPVATPEPVVEEKTELRCPNCNSEITEDIAFCTECGTRVK